MPPGLLVLLPHLRRHLPALCPTPRSSTSHKRPVAFFAPVRAAVSGYSGMAAGWPEQQQQQRSVVVRETVELTETEERIFNRLLEVVSHFGLGTQLRVAGGWVRDKIDLMMSDKHPVRAMRDIRDLGLFYVVFSFPEKSNPPLFDKCDWQCVSHIEAAWDLVYSICSSVFSSGSDPKLQELYLNERRRLCLYSSLLNPLRNMFYLDKRSKKVPVSTFIIKDSLKLKNSDAETVINIHAASEKFAELIPLLESNPDVCTLKEKLEDEYLEIPEDSVKRVFAGLVLREIKDFWQVALLLSILSYPEAESAADTLNRQDELHRRREKYIRVERFITGLDLDGVWKLKPVLDGKSIMGVMQVKSGGPFIGQWQQRVLKWQLAHPNGTVDECIEWMKQSQSKRQKVESST